MLCPLCNHRKTKRACPALGKPICAICCGTKRLVEINCPADCVYLASSRAHPPAIVQRQQEMDRAMVIPLLQGLSERQARVFLMLAAATARHQVEMLQKLIDEDIAQAAGALAATLETAGRGIVYEHQTASLPAARLMAELRTVVEEMSKNAGSVLDRDAAIALRRFEHAASMMATATPNTNEFQQLLGRVLAPGPGPLGTNGAEDGPPESRDAGAPSLIIP